MVSKKPEIIVCGKFKKKEEEKIMGGLKYGE